MPTVKCPHCKQRGETGPAVGPVDSPPDHPDILAGPQLPGSTKSLLLCHHCNGAFFKGPIGRGTPALRDLWGDYAQQVSGVLPDSMKVRAPFTARRPS
jgi:hypothetical protein